MRSNFKVESPSVRVKGPLAEMKLAQAMTNGQRDGVRFSKSFSNFSFIANTPRGESARFSRGSCDQEADQTPR